MWGGGGMWVRKGEDEDVNIHWLMASFPLYVLPIMTSCMEVMEKRTVLKEFLLVLGPLLSCKIHKKTLEPGCNIISLAMAWIHANGSRYQFRMCKKV